ncbi:hypothetical protein F5148DRAFT_393032 [Russula earlei]|uniref:Uncharacterized protein n=1 Tax=Russula earlei TaxID=71964 RepID=A0ACC0TZZ5_9AGAM|nr:hypothetical protein F5148DRAFT_393032 [Russula earlei]
MNEMRTRLNTTSNARVSTNYEADVRTQPSQAEPRQGEPQSAAQSQSISEVVPNSEMVHRPPPIDCGSRGLNSNGETGEICMIGDFDSRANALWSLYGKEAKGHDESQIQTLKDDMDGVLIFAGLFSAVLTGFTIDSKQALKPSPSDQMVYYLQQNVAMLSQISRQVSFLAPQLVIPTTPPPPFPTSNPSSSDIRVNAFWFMALGFSLSAALLAILVQQWVRDYMHVFQRYGDPLKSARIRQFLYEGSEGWYMPIVAEAVPGLLHISLFLFFIGLGDSVMNINTTVGLSTTIPIGICGLLYLFYTFASVIYPQAPYQNSFSGFIWYGMQKLRWRKYQDRDGKRKPVSTNMVQGQLQLAMEGTEERLTRDARSIRWLLDNLTEDAEIEALVKAMPGSFNEEWGAKVWKKVSTFSRYENNGNDTNEFVVGPLAHTNDQSVTPVVTLPSTRFHVPNLFGSILRLVSACTASRPTTNTGILVPALHSHNTHLSVVTTSAERNVVYELSRHIARLFEASKNCSVYEGDTSLVW